MQSPDKTSRCPRLFPKPGSLVTWTMNFGPKKGPAILKEATKDTKNKVHVVVSCYILFN